MRKTVFFSAFILGVAGTVCGQAGTDVIIDYSPASQLRVELDIAFNGWIYSAGNFDVGPDQVGLVIKCSKDNGVTWTEIDRYSPVTTKYNVFDIAVAGTDTNNLKLFVVGVNNNTTTGNYITYVDTYDATAGLFIGSVFYQNNGTGRINDVSIATDYAYPAVGASPYSVAFVYSKYSSVDSIAYVASLDGGNSFTTRQTVATTNMYSRKVSLAYGRGLSASNGRYFAAWERLTSYTVRTGNIYTSHNGTFVNSSFIAPKNLDSLSGSMTGKCRNPRIAVQYGTTDNDSAAVSAVVLMDRDFNGDGSDYDVLGFYNKRAHFTNFWYRLDVENSGDNMFSGDIVYDPLNSRFLATYFDSTSSRLPYVTNAVNLPAPNTWTMAIANYVDSTQGLVSPFPRLASNPAKAGRAGFTWVRKVNGRGVSYFDAQFAAKSTNIVAQICAGQTYTFNGANLATAGLYQDTLLTSYGGDSLISLNLSVNPVPVPTVVLSGANAVTTQAFVSYQWQFNGSNIPGATGQTFTGLTNGVYTVTVTDANGCTATSAPFTLTNAGVAEQEKPELKIYPNPASTFIRISAPVVPDDVYTVSDISGRRLMTISGKDITQDIDISQLKAGIYLVDRNGTAAVRIVVAR